MFTQAQNNREGIGDLQGDYQMVSAASFLE